MKTFSQIFTTIALSIVSMSGFAQTNVGQDCGCPPVASRGAAIPISSLGVNASGELTSDVTLTCDKMYTLDQKIYVPSGRTLAIQAGTVVKASVGTLATAPALIVERGGKIFASGKEECPIIFTTVEDDLTGTYGIQNRGKWGGIAICGNASNNSVSGYGNYVSAGVAFLEGFYAIPADAAAGIADTRIHYGGTNNNDNSGIFQYVSIRHTGATLIAGNEINALTLGSVGKGTQIDHIEIVSCDDDNIELFGGNVNLKYITTVFGADDMIDSDHGWSGKAQFLFGLKASHSIATTDDNGFEMDGGDKKTETTWGRPVISNATLIGNDNRQLFSDNSGVAAICSKDRNEGELYNSIFANFRYGINFQDGNYAADGAKTAFNHWVNGTNNFKNNTFVGIPAASALAIARDTMNADLTTYAAAAKFATDGNVVAASIPGFLYSFAINGATNAISTNVDVVPSSTDAAFTLTDPFFTPVTYRGAFEPGKKPWLSKFAQYQLTKYASELAKPACATDITLDNQTTTDDLFEILNNLNGTCGQ